MKKKRKQHIRLASRSPYGTWSCSECSLIFNTRSELKQHKRTMHPKQKGYSWNKGLTKDTDPRIKKYSQTLRRKLANGEIVRNVSIETRQKLSKSLKLAIKEGRAKGWQSRNIASYAEKFWKKVLDNNNIEFKFNFPIKKSDLGLNDSNCYFLDFALLNKKVDLEIDGSQHCLLERQQSDNKRDNALISNGWKVYRISWNKLKTDAEKQEMKIKIDQFLSWYQSL